MERILLDMTRAAQPTDLPSIGDRLAATRKALGLSQEAAADIGGISAKAWSEWERGTRTPAVSSMLRLRARYGISLDWIYAGDPARLPHEIASQVLLA